MAYKIFRQNKVSVKKYLDRFSDNGTVWRFTWWNKRGGQLEQVIEVWQIRPTRLNSLKDKRIQTENRFLTSYTPTAYKILEGNGVWKFLTQIFQTENRLLDYTTHGL